MSRVALLFLCLSLFLVQGLDFVSAGDTGTALAASKRQSAGQATQRERRQVYSGNVKTRVYHNGQCRHFNCKSCSEIFDSPQEAIGKGYKACQQCGG